MSLARYAVRIRNKEECSSHSITQSLVLTSSDEAYGIGGRDAILSMAASKGVCVANTIGVTETTESLNKVKDELLKKPFAKMILLFVRSHVTEPLLRR